MAHPTDRHGCFDNARFVSECDGIEYYRCDVCGQSLEQVV